MGTRHSLTRFPGGDRWDVVGLFEAGESGTCGFDVNPGCRHRFASTGDDHVVDIDLRFHDEQGREIRCDITGDARPGPLREGGRSVRTTGAMQPLRPANVISERRPC